MSSTTDFNSSYKIKLCSQLLVLVCVVSPATIKITTMLECVNVIYFSRNRSIRTTTKYLYKTTPEEHAIRSFFCSCGGEGQSFSVPTGGGSVHFRLNYYIRTIPLILFISSLHCLIKCDHAMHYSQFMISCISKVKFVKNKQNTLHFLFLLRVHGMISSFFVHEKVWCLPLSSMKCTF